MQYYLELNPEIEGIYFESSEFPKASKELDVIAKKLGLPSHFDLFSTAAQNDLCPPEYQEKEIPWYDLEMALCHGYLAIRPLRPRARRVRGDSAVPPGLD